MRNWGTADRAVRDTRQTRPASAVPTERVILARRFPDIVLPTTSAQAISVARTIVASPCPAVRAITPAITLAPEIRPAACPTATATARRSAQATSA